MYTRLWKLTLSLFFRVGGWKPENEFVARKGREWDWVQGILDFSVVHKCCVPVLCKSWYKKVWMEVWWTPGNAQSMQEEQQQIHVFGSLIQWFFIKFYMKAHLAFLNLLLDSPMFCAFFTRFYLNREPSCLMGRTGLNSAFRKMRENFQHAQWCMVPYVLSENPKSHNRLSRS